MITDRELSDGAAKAAGISGDWSKTFGGWDCLVESSGNYWQPLHDDGDALRLAVKLKIEPHFMEGGGTDAVRCDESGNEATLASETSSDLYADTRRAIVRAAYEISKAKPADQPKP